MTAGLRWKLQRARSMSPSELAWRLSQRIALERWKAKAGRPAAELPLPEGGFRAAYRQSSAAVGPVLSPEALEREFPGETARVVARAEAVCAGRIELFARTYEFGGDPARWPWNRDPAGNGPEVELAFGPTLDYRDPSRVGDARLAWELGRHGFLVPLGQAAFLTRDPRYVRQAFAALEAWIEACPPYQGLQWASALEYALRAFSWGYALALIARTPAADDIADARWERVLASWAEQMRFVAAHDARHSSANNHRLGEAAGLAWSGRLLAFLPEAASWRERGLAVLEESLLAQTTEDGVTREHAFAYQHFVLDFAIAVHALERGAMPEPVRARIERLAAWLERVSPGGLTWPVGDGDEGQALPTGEPFKERVLGSLECAAALTGAPWSGPRSARAQWLGLVPVVQADVPAVGSQVVAGGYVIAQRGEARVLFDVAELGLAPLYAHGHADALQVLLDVRGPRLIDPGTGGYHAQAALRERLRSTAAHNTVEVDGVSQSQPGGLFQWLRPARVFDVRVGEFEWSAAHDGYAHLGVIHRRSVSWPEPRCLVIEDALEGKGVHRAVGRWFLGEADVRVETENSCGAGWPDGFGLDMRFELPEGAGLEMQSDGDWAPRFLAPRTSRVVEVKVEGPLPLSWRTTLSWDH